MPSLKKASQMMQDPNLNQDLPNQDQQQQAPAEPEVDPEHARIAKHVANAVSGFLGMLKGPATPPPAPTQGAQTLVKSLDPDKMATFMKNNPFNKK